ncbi:MAG: hypothetical protein WKG52_09085 [Variovorax sp.]
MQFPFLFRLAALALCAATVSACSLVFNWREVLIADDGLVALLPCKADRATRTLPLGGETITVDMTGCEAGGATFAIAHAAASSADQAEAWMHAWRAATRSQLANATVAEAPAVLPRASAMPAPVRLDAQGADRASTMHVVWFAQQRAGRMALYQATVVGEPSQPEALTTFIEGLRLP